MKSDLVTLICDLCKGILSRAEMSEDIGVTVIMATKGYPGAYEKGSLISGLEEAGAPDDTMIFHAGTSLNSVGDLQASGGRVLAVTAFATRKNKRVIKPMMRSARPRDEGFYRTDIAKETY